MQQILTRIGSRPVDPLDDDGLGRRRGIGDGENAAERRDGRVGIWVAGQDGTEEKIAAIGVRIRHWVTFHGIAINVNPDLEHFSGIIPCGIAGYGVTSLDQLGVQASLEDVDAVLRETFAFQFGD